jgi:hypothetical protein
MGGFSILTEALLGRMVVGRRVTHPTARTETPSTTTGRCTITVKTIDRLERSPPV